MIHIWEPRYHNGFVLIDVKKIERGKDNTVKIVKKYYSGLYNLKRELVDRLIEEGEIEHKNYAMGDVDLLRVPLDELTKEKIEEEEVVDKETCEKIMTLLK